MSGWTHTEALYLVSSHFCTRLEGTGHTDRTTPHTASMAVQRDADRPASWPGRWPQGRGWNQDELALRNEI